VKFLRVAIRGALAAIVTAGLWLPWLAGHLLLVLAPRCRRPWRRWVFRTWGRNLCRVLRIEVEVQGRPPVEPCVLVCNHLSYVDIPVIAGRLDTVFVAKSEVARWPAIGLLSRTMGTIFVERDRKRSIPEVNRRTDAALRAGDGVVIFPEGTSTNGAAVAPFRASLLAPAAEAERPVYVASLRYELPAGGPSAADVVCWWGDMAFVPHLLGLLALERVRARLVFAPDPVRASDRKLLAEKLWQAVDRIFIPIA